MFFGCSGLTEPVSTFDKSSLRELKVEVITRQMQLEATRYVLSFRRYRSSKSGPHKGLFSVVAGSRWPQCPKPVLPVGIAK